MSVKAAIGTIMDAMVTTNGNGFIPNPSPKDKVGAKLFEVFVWQEIAKSAASRLEKAWEVLQADGAVVPTDDSLRADVVDESIVAESKHFSCVVKVTTPRNSLDVDLLVGTIAKKYKAPTHQVEALVEASKVAGKAPLTKRILEVGT